MGDHAQPQTDVGYPHALPAVWLFFPGRAGRCHFRSQHRHAGEPCRTERAGSRYPGEKGIAAQPFGLYRHEARP
ncbi:hypothetical protein CNEO3_150062 [Clostridium neonatale]|nr:hypothetical protein CNEO3_130061 [Clostridium neonatale]CAI3567182.1 hypothetical protein CNEO3_1440001 [Clostridium neonatale]CAI3589260.1 hypothetical protein CNEO3_150062 [Clostridium neonatale]CAI3602031.1 hypothetical protein CNEO3_190061 [Clostridium neonatale]CAI3661141.1 hypothetical protein CNEO3_700018 [Clostridium neonatale]